MTTPIKHVPPCTGGHTSDVSCEAATLFRLHAMLDQWTCRFSPSRGQPAHHFADGENCSNEGCGAKYSKLMNLIDPEKSS